MLAVAKIQCPQCAVAGARGAESDNYEFLPLSAFGFQPNLLATRPVRRVGLLGNKFSQAPTFQAVAESLADLYYFKLFNACQSAFKLSLLKQQKFTPEGKEKRVAASLAALNAAQPTELSLQQWKEIFEEIEDDED